VTPVEGTSYEQDLQRVHVPNDDALFCIEKARVLKQNKGQALIKWKGWSDKNNSCIPSSELDYFYMTFPNHANKADFTNNQANAFTFLNAINFINCTTRLATRLANYYWQYITLPCSTLVNYS